MDLKTANKQLMYSYAGVLGAIAIALIITAFLVLYGVISGKAALIILAVIIGICEILRHRIYKRYKEQTSNLEQQNEQRKN